MGVQLPLTHGGFGPLSRFPLDIAGHGSAKCSPVQWHEAGRAYRRPHRARGGGTDADRVQIEVDELWSYDPMRYTYIKANWRDYMFHVNEKAYFGSART